MRTAMFAESVEWLSPVVSAIGSSAIKYNACIARSFIVGIPSGRNFRSSFDIHVLEVVACARLFRVNMALAFANGRPCNLVNAGSRFSFVSRNSFYRQCFGVERVGKHPLQGFHLCYVCLPLSLYNTCLQLLDKTLAFVPVDFRPEFVNVYVSGAHANFFAFICFPFFKSSVNYLVKCHHRRKSAHFRVG